MLTLEKAIIKKNELIKSLESKIRKDTLDKTIETINQMKASSGRKSAGSGAVSYMQKKNSY